MKQQGGCGDPIPKVESPSRMNWDHRCLASSIVMIHLFLYSSFLHGTNQGTGFAKEKKKRWIALEEVKISRTERD